MPEGLIETEGVRDLADAREALRRQAICGVAVTCRELPKKRQKKGKNGPSSYSVGVYMHACKCVVVYVQRECVRARESMCE
jgi:hypothetical protein